MRRRRRWDPRDFRFARALKYGAGPALLALGSGALGVVLVSSGVDHGWGILPAIGGAITLLTLAIFLVLSAIYEVRMRRWYRRTLAVRSERDAALARSKE